MMNTTEKATYEFCLRLGDSALILSQRLSEWCGHGPVLEEDIALTNIALDLLGQSRNMLIYAAEIEGNGKNEDQLAFLRDTNEFRNYLITEQPNYDYAYTIARQYFYDLYSWLLFKSLKKSSNQRIADLSEKAHKEITYHLRHSSQWILRLGDGTDESNTRLQQAVDNLWMYTGDFFDTDETDALLVQSGVIPDVNSFRDAWKNSVEELFAKAKIRIPVSDFALKGSRKGIHTEHLGHLLSEMQFLQRAYPGLEW